MGDVREGGGRKEGEEKSWGLYKKLCYPIFFLSALLTPPLAQPTPPPSSIDVYILNRLMKGKAKLRYEGRRVGGLNTTRPGTPPS